MNKINLKAYLFDGLTFAFAAFTLAFYFMNPSEEQLLNLKFNSTLFLIFLLFGVGISIVLNHKSVRTWGEQVFLPPQKRATDAQRSIFKTLWGWQAFVVLALIFTVGYIVTQISLFELTDADGFAGAQRLFLGILNPDWAILPRAVISVIETIFMAFMATALALPFAFLISFLAAQNIMRGPFAYSIYLFLRTILNVTRSIEALIWAIIFSVWVGIGPFAGMLALMIHSVASLAKQFSEMIESADIGPIDGVTATGASPLQVIWFAIVPQVTLPFIAFTLYRWDINVRMATIIGLVGGGGIGTLLIQYQGQAMWPQVGCILLVISVVVWILDQASAIIREALK